MSLTDSLLPLHICMDTCDALFLEAPAAGPLAQIYAQDLLFYFLDLSVSPLLPSRSYNRALYNVRFRKIKGTPNGVSPLYFPALCVAVEGTGRWRCSGMNINSQYSGPLLNLCLYSKEGLRHI